MTPPVLFLVFNRPDTTRQVFEAIRDARPERLYVAADGPRVDRDGEEVRCAEVRRIATSVDWPCEVKTLFRDHNFGCRRAVSEAITWFFGHEEEGIILEDDCLPHRDFFSWCGAMLERYRDEPRIMCVTGNNFQADMSEYLHSYYYSIFNHCWGWASWRRAWLLYDAELEQYDSKAARKKFRSMSNLSGFAHYFATELDRVNEGQLNSWAFIWTWTCWLRGGLTCTPRVNLVSNIGFGADATHTTGDGYGKANLPVAPLPPPYVAPPRIAGERRFDAHVARTHYGINHRSLFRRAAGRLKRMALRAGILREVRSP